jgi:tetratricopeptide (TPR) repeat protein
MPRYRGWDVAHTASTDHRIVRRPADQAPPAADRENAVLVDFYQDRFPGGDPQGERSLGLGLVKAMDAGLLSPRRQGDRALRLLEAALANDPTDSSVREGKVEAYLLLDRPSEALSEAELLLAQQQQSWQLLVQAAYAAEAEGQHGRARDYWRRAADSGPQLPKYLLHLVRLLIEAGQLDEAQGYCERLLRVDPFNVSGRQAWVGLLLEQGRRAEAQRAFDIIRKLAPSDLAQREKWFRKQIR